MKNHSFFSQFSDAIIFGVICVTIPVIFSLGYYYGLSHSDRAAAVANIRNREMRDSLDIYLQKEISLRQEVLAPAESTVTSNPSSAY